MACVFQCLLRPAKDDQQASTVGEGDVLFCVDYMSAIELMECSGVGSNSSNMLALLVQCNRLGMECFKRQGGGGDLRRCDHGYLLVLG